MNKAKVSTQVEGNQISNSNEIIDLEQDQKQSIKYNYRDVLESSTEYFSGDELAATVWINKYALKDSTGNIYELNPDDMHRRLARELHRIEKRYPNPLDENLIYKLLKNFRHLIPQGGSMSGIGNDFQVSSLSNCFVIGNQADSYGGIMITDEEQTQLMKRRGGVGHDLSHIRPRNSNLNNNALKSTGIVPFMERFSNSTREVAQDGRRGALMLSLDVRHPDIKDFIDAKLESNKITGANISVKINDTFMKAVLKDGEYNCKFPIHSNTPERSKSIKAKKVWDKLVYNAWKSAEPGILFWDTIVKESIADCYHKHGFKSVSTNPCGEIPLCPYDSCRLIAINLYSYVENPFQDNASFNFKLFKEHVNYATQIMDDIIDLEIEKINSIISKIRKDPESDEIKKTEISLWRKILRKCINGRRAGIGITAEGDMLAALNYRYGSDEAIEFSVKVHKTLAISAYQMSARLAEQRGPFPIYDAELEKDNPFINRLKGEDPELYQRMASSGRRNISMLTIAPTGTTSLMCQTSSGIEPVFLINYKRRRKVNPNDEKSNISFVDKNSDSWEEYNVVHPGFADWLSTRDIDLSDVRKMDSDRIKELIQQSPYNGSTSNEIDWMQKVKMQGAIQKWVDHSISVTINLPRESTTELVDQLLKEAWKTGCKGVTVYRDGSRDGVLISTEDDSQKCSRVFNENHSPRRPRKLEVKIMRFLNENENWLAFIGLMDKKPYEIFTGRVEDSFNIPPYVHNGWVIKCKELNGHNRYDFQYKDQDGYTRTIEGLSRSFKKEYWNYAKLISGVLRHGMPLPYVVDLVSRLSFDNQSINSWANGVTRALQKFIPDGTPAAGKACENCNEQEALVFQEGCLICQNCGFSLCN